MAGKLEGKIAIVTGASSGIGEATAVALAAEGATVVAVARRADKLAGVVACIEAGGGKSVAVTADVADEAAAKAMVADTKARFGRVDILVNNAGTMGVGPIHAEPANEFRAMLEVNVFGTMVATQAAIPVMKAQGGGHIVNLSSVISRLAMPNQAAYGTTKAAVNAFTDTLRKEVHKDRIRVTLILPGATVSDITSAITNPAIKKMVDERRGAIAMLHAEDIAAAIVYAVTQPERVNVNEILIRPTDQEM